MFASRARARRRLEGDGVDVRATAVFKPYDPRGAATTFALGDRAPWAARPGGSRNRTRQEVLEWGERTYRGHLPLPYRVLVVVDAERSVRVYEWPLSPGHPVTAHWRPSQVQVTLHRHRLPRHVRLRVIAQDGRGAWLSARTGVTRRAGLRCARAVADALGGADRPPR